MIGERLEVKAMIGIEPHRVYRFSKSTVLSLPDLTIKVNSCDDLKKNMHFYIKSTADVT